MTTTPPNKARIMEQQLLNEITLLKQSYFRISKRVVAIEKLLKSKFGNENISKSLDINVNQTKNSTASSTSMGSSARNAPVHGRQPVIVVQNLPQRPTTSMVTRSVSLSPIKIQPQSPEPQGTVVDVQGLSETESDNSDEDMDDDNGDFITGKARDVSPPGPPHDYKTHGSHNDHGFDVHGAPIHEIEIEIANVDTFPPGTDDETETQVLHVDEQEQEADAKKWLIGKKSKPKTEPNSNISNPNPSEGEKKPKGRIPRKDPDGSIKCQICEKVFYGPRARKNRDSHKEIHNKSRSYKCPFCDKCFNQKRPRRAHIGRIHNNEKARVHGCSQCDKKFCSGQERRVHERIHTGEKPFVCTEPECDFRCSQMQNLVRHKTTKHLGGPSFLCFQCGKAFTSQRSLSKHESNVHIQILDEDGNPIKRERTVDCDLCPSKFFDRSGLLLHKRRMHRTTIPTRGRGRPYSTDSKQVVQVVEIRYVNPEENEGQEVEEAVNNLNSLSNVTSEEQG